MAHFCICMMCCQVRWPDRVKSWCRLIIIKLSGGLRLLTTTLLTATWTQDRVRVTAWLSFYMISHLHYPEWPIWSSLLCDVVTSYERVNTNLPCGNGPDNWSDPCNVMSAGHHYHHDLTVNLTSELWVEHFNHDGDLFMDAWHPLLKLHLCCVVVPHLGEWCQYRAWGPDGRRYVGSRVVSVSWQLLGFGR